jgi:hypothetical protein
MYLHAKMRLDRCESKADFLDDIRRLAISPTSSASRLVTFLEKKKDIELYSIIATKFIQLIKFFKKILCVSDVVILKFCVLT